MSKLWIVDNSGSYETDFAIVRAGSLEEATEMVTAMRSRSYGDPDYPADVEPDLRRYAGGRLALRAQLGSEVGMSWQGFQIAEASRLRRWRRAAITVYVVLLLGSLAAVALAWAGQAQLAAMMAVGVALALLDVLPHLRRGPIPGPGPRRGSPGPEPRK